MTPRRAKLILAVALAVVVVVGVQASRDDGVASEFRLQPSGSPFTRDPTLSTVAEARVPQVAVYDRAGAAEPIHLLANPNADGAPLVFLAASHRQGWIEVLLPVRPNGSRGWVREADVTLTQHDYRMKVELGSHRLIVWKGTTAILRTAIGTGKDRTPTPEGLYYVTELLQPPEPNGLYGAYAFGISGFSNVLSKYKGGPGAVGIHGTNDPSSVGRNVSHGCIRVTNDAISTLARIVPLGTPVFIEA